MKMQYFIAYGALLLWRVPLLFVWGLVIRCWLSIEDMVSRAGTPYGGSPYPQWVEPIFIVVLGGICVVLSLIKDKYIQSITFLALLLFSLHLKNC